MPQLPIVYVSYSRDEEEQNKTISEMQKKLQDIAFQIDTEQVKYRDDFFNYIEKIGQAESVVVVFSEDYLKSFYCMYELTKIMQKGGDLRKRVFSIRNEEYELINVNNQKYIFDYWQQVVNVGEETRPECLTMYGSLAEIKEIQSQLKNIFEHFSTTHAPTAQELAPTFKSLFDDSYQAIREWLKDVVPEVVLTGKKQLSDEKFTFKVEKEITRIFEQFPVLYNRVKEEFDNVNDESTLSITLCTYDDQAELLAYTLLDACKQTVESYKQKESNEKVQELKSGVRKLLNCLCVMAINPGWVKTQSGNQQRVILIPAVTSLGEVSLAGRLGQVIPDISVQPENKVTGKYEISPFKLGTWDNKESVAVDSILRFIFNEVIDTPQLIGSVKENEVITEGQRIELNTQVKLNALDGSRYYYCILRKKETAPQFLNDYGLIQELKVKLPALDVFELQDTMGNIAFLATNEHELSQTYHHFLTQIEQW